MYQVKRNFVSSMTYYDCDNIAITVAAQGFVERGTKRPGAGPTFRAPVEPEENCCGGQDFEDLQDTFISYSIYIWHIISSKK